MGVLWLKRAGLDQHPSLRRFAHERSHLGHIFLVIIHIVQATVALSLVDRSATAVKTDLCIITKQLPGWRVAV